LVIPTLLLKATPSPSEKATFTLFSNTEMGGIHDDPQQANHILCSLAT